MPIKAEGWMLGDGATRELVSNDDAQAHALAA